MPVPFSGSTSANLKGNGANNKSNVPKGPNGANNKSNLNKLPKN